MGNRKLLLLIACILFLVPVVSLVSRVPRLALAYDSAAHLPEEERPAALSRAVADLRASHYYGVAAYFLGFAILLLLARHGDKSESRFLWYFAIGTAGTICVNETFFLGILALILLIWKRKYFKVPGAPGPLALVVAGFFLLFPAQADACSCLPQGNIQERKAVNDLVFDGRLTSVAVDTAQGTKRMRFTVRKAWKRGKREWVKHVRIETPLESATCGFEMKVGERVLVFATESRENGRRVYRTDLCSENIPAPSRRQADSLGMKPLKRPPPKDES